jgi:hypothetical protein
MLHQAHLHNSQAAAFEPCHDRPPSLMHHSSFVDENVAGHQASSDPGSDSPYCLWDNKSSGGPPPSGGSRQVCSFFVRCRKEPDSSVKGNRVNRVEVHLIPFQLTGKKKVHASKLVARFENYVTKIKAQQTKFDTRNPERLNRQMLSGLIQRL